MEDPGWLDEYTQVISSGKMHNTNFSQNDTNGIKTLFPNATLLPFSTAPPQSEKLVKMKNRKMKKQAKENDKKGKQVISTKEGAGEYNIENVLAELGEVSWYTQL